jgi:hypothetical protein
MARRIRNTAIRGARPVVVTLLSAFVAAGCPSAPQQTPEPDGDLLPPDPTPQPEDVPGDDTPDEPAPVGGDDYEMTPEDCRALATIYGKVWKADEVTKLEARKLKEKPHQEALAAIEQDAAETKGNWQSECDKTVGSPYLRSRLDCAMKAKTVQHFDDCLDGKKPE